MNTTLGFAITGSFCTHATILEEMEKLVKEGYNLIPIFSFNVASMNTRFFQAAEFRQKVIQITGKEPIDTLQLAEPLGPSGVVDVMVVAPCTGNTLAKLANAVTDTPVCMAVKSHLRNNKPVVIAISTNDGLGLNMKNLAMLMATKNVFFVPFGQDNFAKKPNSLISDYTLLKETVEAAKHNQQLQPVLLRGKDHV